MPREYEDRRQLRRNRRIRNQVLAWLVLVLLILAAICAVVFLLKGSGAKAEGRQQEAVPTPEPEPVAEPEQATIGTPEELDEELLAEPTEAAVQDQTDPRILALLDGMSLEQKIDGLFMVSPEAITGVEAATAAGEGTKDALTKYAVGAIVYDSKNVDSAEKFADMVSNTKDMYRELYNRRLLTFVDEEGGSMSISEKLTDSETQPAAATLAAEGDSGAVTEAYRAIAELLAEYGIDGDLAPVASVATASDCYLGDRAFSEDAGQCAQMVAAAVTGLSDGGRLSSLASFPGEGEASRDPENAEISSQRSPEELRGCEFLPFLSGMEAGADMIMLSNIKLEAVDSDASSLFSQELVRDILRTELGFEGLIVTAPLDQAACTEAGKPGNAAVKAFLAGADMLYIRNRKDFEVARAAIAGAVEDGTISEERVDESLKRLYALLIKMDQA